MAVSGLLLFATGAIVLAGVYFTAHAGHGPEDFTQVTFVNNTSSEYDDPDDHIDTAALWNKQQLVVLPKQDGDIKHYKEMSKLLEVAVAGDELEDATWSVPVSKVYEGK